MTLIELSVRLHRADGLRHRHVSVEAARERGDAGALA